jgi:hypothetical protein
MRREIDDTNENWRNYLNLNVDNPELRSCTPNEWVTASPNIKRWIYNLFMSLMEERSERNILIDKLTAIRDLV